MIMLVGVAIDLVRAHVTKTKLSKAADAAARVAVDNFDREQTEAAAAARTAFKANSLARCPGYRPLESPA